MHPVGIVDDLVLLQAEYIQSFHLQQALFDRPDGSKERDMMTAPGERLRAAEGNFARAAIHVREVVQDHNIHVRKRECIPGSCFLRE